MCGNDTVRTPHPVELFGGDWLEWARERGRDDDLGMAPEGDRASGLREHALESLRGLVDPELGLNIVDLGLVYGLRVDGADLHVDLSMTSPACPLGGQIAEEAEERLLSLSGVDSVVVRLVWEPPWDPSRMSASARAALGWGR
jgi:metal-sulfur cluster biosynthetic enzyme